MLDSAYNAAHTWTSFVKALYKFSYKIVLTASLATQ